MTIMELSEQPIDQKAAVDSEMIRLRDQIREAGFKLLVDDEAGNSEYAAGTPHYVVIRDCLIPSPKLWGLFPRPPRPARIVVGRIDSGRAAVCQPCEAVPQSELDELILVIAATGRQLRRYSNPVIT